MKHDELDEKELEELESRLRRAVAGRKPEPPASLVDFIETVPARGATRRMGVAFGGLGLWHGLAVAAASAAVVIAVAGTAVLMSIGPDRGTAVASGTISAPSIPSAAPTEYLPVSEWPWASGWPSESEWPTPSEQPSAIREPSGTDWPYSPVPLDRTIAGRVTDLSGNPVAGFVVVACGRWCWNQETDSSGHYALQVAAGHYVMHFAVSGDHPLDYASGYLGPTGFTYDRNAARDIDVTSVSATGVDVALPPALHATLHLVNSSGASLAGIYCWIHAGGANWGTSDANGYCSAVVVPGQDVWFQFEDPSHVYASGYYSSSSPGGYTSYDGDPTRLTVPASGVEVEVTIPALPSASPSAPPTASPSAAPSASPSAS
jgi:hypothetical protein